MTKKVFKADFETLYAIGAPKNSIPAIDDIATILPFDFIRFFKKISTGYTQLIKL